MLPSQHAPSILTREGNGQGYHDSFMTILSVWVLVCWPSHCREHCWGHAYIFDIPGRILPQLLNIRNRGGGKAIDHFQSGISDTEWAKSEPIKSDLRQSTHSCRSIRRRRQWVSVDHVDQVVVRHRQYTRHTVSSNTSWYTLLYPSMNHY